MPSDKVLHACVELCEILGKEALMRLRSDLGEFPPEDDRSRDWKLNQRRRIERILEILDDETS